MKKTVFILTLSMLLCSCNAANDIAEYDTHTQAAETTAVSTELTAVSTEESTVTTEYTNPTVPSRDSIEVSYSEDDENIILGKESADKYSESLWEYFGTACLYKWKTAEESRNFCYNSYEYTEVIGLYTDKEKDEYIEMDFSQVKEYLINQLDITERCFNEMCVLSAGSYIEENGKLYVGMVDGYSNGGLFSYIRDYTVNGDTITYNCRRMSLYSDIDSGLEDCDRYRDFSFTLKNENGIYKLDSCTDYFCFFQGIDTAGEVNAFLKENDYFVTENAVEEDIGSYEQQFIDFMNSIVENSLDKSYPYIGFYDFWEDTVIDSYTYSSTYDRSGFKVTVSCSQSSCEIIPVGTSEWYYSYYEKFIPWDSIQRFYHSYYYFEKPNDYFSAYNAARYFTFMSDLFEADIETIKSCKPDSHMLFHAFNPYYTLVNDEGPCDVTPEEFIAATKKLYNIDVTEEYMSDFIGDDGFMTTDCGHGAGWNLEILKSYTETDSEIRVTIDYYGDYYYFYPVIESEYTFSKNEDGTITLQNIEKIFDRGYEVASDAV